MMLPAAQKTPPAVRTPLADFEDRVAAYMKIHKAAASDKGALSPTKSPAQIDAKQTALADGIRKQRSNAKQGDIFTTPIAAEFRKIIAADMKRRPERISQSIKSGAVVSTKVEVNGAYPEDTLLETMPPTLLASLPKLPPELVYRFIGSTLVLHDVGANVIVDLMPNAIVLK